MATAQKPDTNNLPVPTVGSPMPIAAGETSSSAIAARERAAVEARFLVAMHRPRNFDRAFARLMTACQRPTFAEVARYTKPVGGQKVHGLSARFAEEARVDWGNLDVSAFLVFDDDERRIYRVIGTDLETNATEGMDVMVEKFVERRQVRDGMEVIGQRQNTTGQVVYRIRATEDDLLVKVNNQISKARRNVILSLIPADVKEECERRIIQTLSDRDAKDPEAARKAIVLSFHALGVDAAQLEVLLGHALAQVTPAELTLLRSYYTALKDGESAWADIVEAHGAANGKRSEATPTAKGTDGLREAVSKRAGAAKAPSDKPEAAAPAGNVCTVCGGKDGQHKSDCRYFAD